MDLKYPLKYAFNLRFHINAIIHGEVKMAGNRFRSLDNFSHISVGEDISDVIK